MEALISSCIFFPWAACGQVFLSDHLVAIHLSGGLRKELISLVSLALSAFCDGKLPLSPLKILTTDRQTDDDRQDVDPSGYLPGFLGSPALCNGSSSFGFVPRVFLLHEGFKHPRFTSTSVPFHPRPTVVNSAGRHQA